jgi:RNA polymerase sigma-70 factor (ECF subfamily)
MGGTVVQPHHEACVRDAFEANHAGLVRRLTAITRNPDDAEDLAQEAFVRLAVELESGRRPDDVPAWLHRVGWNLAMSRGRHVSVVNRRNGELPEPQPPTQPDRAAINRETHQAVLGALGNLSVVERDAMVLAADGYHGDELALAIGRTIGATRTLLCRARAKVRTQLEADLLLRA